MSIKTKVLALRSKVIAFTIGFRDGWRQPYELHSSSNVESLPGDYLENQEVLDTGINWGQRVRSPFRHQKEV